MRRWRLLLAVIMAMVFVLVPVGGQAASMTIADMVVIARHMNGQSTLTEEQIAVYDLTGDGLVNVADLVAVARILTGGASPAPAVRPDYDQLIYTQGTARVTVGDLTQVGYLVGGMLGDRDELDFNVTGVPECLLLGGLSSLYTICSNPAEYPAAAPLGQSLLSPVAAVLNSTEMNEAGAQLLVQAPVTALRNALFGNTKVTDAVAWQDGVWETAPQSGAAWDVTLVQFARYRHTTLALAIFDVSVQDNTFGAARGTVRVGMQFEVSSNAYGIRPLSLKRLAPGQLETSDMAAIFYPATVPI